MVIRKVYIKLITVFVVCLINVRISAQLVVNPHPNALALVQKLVGDGVIISNVSFTGNAEMAGFFENQGGTNITIDSGIVLTSGRARARTPNVGMVGASSLNADNRWGLPGDFNLSGLVAANTNDACVLEFDFIPLGDSIKFNYVFSSEEYPGFSCSNFNDAFAFFIQGPGITGLRNIALVPNTNDPVTIRNINDQGCALYPQYYVNNIGNGFFTHNGHTKVLTALARVQPCETYHLKLVIADVVDDQFDSGVFLEARSLTSNAIGMSNLTQTDPAGNSYLVEGCVSGAFNIRRPRKDPTALGVTLTYGGTAINGTDVQTLPTLVTIPANDSFVTVNVIPIIDNLPEGVETIVVYALAGCTAGTPTDSTIIQVRDYDALTITPQAADICKGVPVQLTASAGYTIYQWNADPTLNATNIPNPLATPANTVTTYICTATEGTCNGKDSVVLRRKEIQFVSKLDVNCKDGTTGNIKVAGGNIWQRPVQFSLNGINWQADSNFYNLPIGLYSVKIRDAACIDSVAVNVVQAFPDLTIANTAISPASCSGAADGLINITGAGGSGLYQYSSDATTFQSLNFFNVLSGDYTITIKDNNGCVATQNVTVPLNNIVTIDAGIDTTICNGTSYLIPAVSNANTFEWTPSTSLNKSDILSPVASPSDTTKYYITATTGICTRIDSIRVNIRPAPVPDAGEDIAVCFGKVFQLDGSGGVSYQWSPVTNFTSASTIANPSAKAKENISYSLMVKDIYGCQSLTSDEVKIKVTPAVKIFAGRDTVAAINQPIQLQAIEIGNAGVTKYSWSPGTFLNNPDISNPVATLLHDYRYLVTGTTPEGCEGLDDVVVKVYKGPDIYVPSGFTPDNNGLNDILRPIPVGIIEFHFFRVFNRWGELIFSSQNPARGWDGKIKGIEQPTGTYVWIAEAMDYKGNLITKKGTVTIIR